jgi:hypothetical protein
MSGAIPIEVNVCDCCGKPNLSGTVALETEGGEVLHYGTTCAGRALRVPGKLVRDRANEMRKAAPVVALVKALVAAGKSVDEVKAEANVLAAKTWINGAPMNVGGFASWGKFNIDWNGGRIEVAI